MQKWELFSQRDSMKIEAMYVTGTHHSLTINGQNFTFRFSHMLNMMQINEDTYSMNPIKRVPVKESTKNDSETGSQYCKTSRILIHASPSDTKEAEEKLSSFINSCNTLQARNIC